MLIAIYAKTLHHSFIPTIYENFKAFFLHVYSEQKFENLHTCFYLIWQLKEQKQFRDTFTQ